MRRIENTTQEIFWDTARTVLAEICNVNYSVKKMLSFASLTLPPQESKLGREKWTQSEKEGNNKEQKERWHTLWVSGTKQVLPQSYETPEGLERGVWITQHTLLCWQKRWADFSENTDAAKHHHEIGQAQ